jgi:protein-S-isoprenylcysteine O-methyltransferase Ste14
VQSSVRRYRPPKVIVILGVGVAYGLVDVAAPIVLSMVGPRHGWDGRWPGPVNLIGVVALVLGAVIVVRALADHARAIRERDWDIIKIDPNHLLTPEYLVVDGVYGCSRNPLYVGDVTMWVGWAALLGSLAVGIGAILLAAGLAIGVRLEERGLARQFGEQWSVYVREVPRFVGKRCP